MRNIPIYTISSCFLLLPRITKAKDRFLNEFDSRTKGAVLCVALNTSIGRFPVSFFYPALKPTLVSLFFFFALSACSNTPTPSTKLHDGQTLDLGETSYWDTEILPQSGQLRIQFKLQRNSKAEFILSENKDDERSPQIRISFSDQDCSNGHLANIEYQPQKGQFYTHYIDQEIPWDRNSTLDISWDHNNNAIILFNTNKLNMTISQKITHLQIISVKNPTIISSIKYSQGSSPEEKQ